MTVSRNGVVSPTIELSTGVRYRFIYLHFSLAHGYDRFACPIDVAWSKAPALLSSISMFVQPKATSPSLILCIHNDRCPQASLEYHLQQSRITT
jgi:hypothetical protein